MNASVYLHRPPDREDLLLQFRQLCQNNWARARFDCKFGPVNRLGRESNAKRLPRCNGPQLARLSTLTAVCGASSAQPLNLSTSLPLPLSPPLSLFLPLPLLSSRDPVFQGRPRSSAAAAVQLTAANEIKFMVSVTSTLAAGTVAVEAAGRSRSPQIR